ncbi:hypothetical protein K438DRAFT_1985114 [Mycena galopus ATCC 62051]|nr:hypothetical protein K438DRAFT_1985114 [Mycena galopus ATCC 62051]
MVDWQSTAEIVKDGVAFGKFMHALLGLYIWEWFTSLGLTGTECEHPHLNPEQLFDTINSSAVALNVTSEVNCQGLYTFNSCFGNAAIGLASINLSLRTIAVWNQRWFIVAPLVAIILGHWQLGIQSRLRYHVYRQSPSAATFIYGMSFDFIVLCLTTYKLLFPTGGKSRLVSLIFNDGLIYFVIAFLSNLLATIFMILNLNPVMSIVANVPAAIASTVVACRAVRRLTNYSSVGAEMFTGATTAARHLRSAQAKPKMETFESPSERSYLEYDAAGQITKAERYDPEAQAVSDDFKRPPY